MSAFAGDYGFGSVSINRAVPALPASASSSKDQKNGQAFADLGYHIALTARNSSHIRALPYRGHRRRLCRA